MHGCYKYKYVIHFSRKHVLIHFSELSGGEKLQGVSVKTEEQTSELGLLSHSSLARSSPAVLFTACSNTSTFSIRVKWS